MLWHLFWYHVLYQDLWLPLWPNLAASLVVYIFVTIKVRALKKIQREESRLNAERHQILLDKHAELKQHVSDAIGQSGQPVHITQNIGPEFSPQTLDTDAARE